MNTVLSKKKFAIPCAILLGQLAPAMFILLDLSELGLKWSITNAFDIYTSQKIYAFTSLVFPLFLILILLFYTRTKNQKVFYQSILDGAQEMVVVFNAQRSRIYSNAAFDKSGLGVQFLEGIDENLMPLNFEVEKIIGGQPKSFLCSVTRSENRLETTAIIKDITILKLNAQKIKEQEESILRSSQLASLGEISSGIAHEINNPLGVIIGNTEILRSQLEFPPPLVLRSLDTIDRMSLRISGIIKAMKNLSRKSELTAVEEIELATIMEDISNLSYPNLKKLDIDFGLDIHKFKGKFITGSTVQISQVMLNLISNATHATENLDDKWITVRLEEDTDFYKIIVQNAGPQIPKELQDKIFQPFFTTKSPGSGTGLGLSLSKTIAEIHKGSLILDGEKRSPTFIFALPKKDKV